MIAHSKNLRTPLLVSVIVICVATTSVGAGGKTKIAREMVEAAAKKFGWKIGGEATETMTARVGQFVSRHGDEGAEAFRRLGPRAYQLAESAGEHASDCVKLLARHGDEAVWVVSRPKRLAIFVKHGDDAATAMIKHQDMVLPLIDRLGQPAATALAKISTRNARRVAMLGDGSLMANPKQATGILNVIGKYGDKAANFIWRNKGSLAIASVLTAFLSNPEPFISGTRELGGTATENVASNAIGYLMQSWLFWAWVLLAAVGIAIFISPWVRVMRWGVTRLNARGRSDPRAESSSSHARDWGG